MDIYQDMKSPVVPVGFKLITCYQDDVLTEGDLIWWLEPGKSAFREFKWLPVNKAYIGFTIKRAADNISRYLGRKPDKVFFARKDANKIFTEGFLTNAV